MESLILNRLRRFTKAIKRDLTEVKKIKGRKRQIVVDTQGHLLAVHVHSARRHDSVASQVVLARALHRYPTLEKIFGDQGYRGKIVQALDVLTKSSMEIVAKIGTGWSKMPKRWIVERTFGWLQANRRLSKDYEMKAKNSENVLKIAQILMVLKKINFLS